MIRFGDNICNNGLYRATFSRCGETEDCYIADLAGGLSTGEINTGAPSRCERYFNSFALRPSSLRPRTPASLDGIK